MKPWELLDLKRVMTRWQKDLEGKGWNSLYLSNHDQPRSVSRFGDDGHYRVESAKMLGTFLHMLQGTPYVYQGEEIGMTNVAFPSIDDYRDIETLNSTANWSTTGGWTRHRHGRHPRQEPRQRPDADAVGRQRQRRVHDRNALDRGQPELPADQCRRSAGRPRLVFHYYKKLIRLRKENPVIVHGRYDLLLEAHGEIYAFTRTYGDDRLLVILNFTANQPVFALPSSITYSAKDLMIANYEVDAGRRHRVADTAAL